MNQNVRTFVVRHRGMARSAIARRPYSATFIKLPTAPGNELARTTCRPSSENTVRSGGPCSEELLDPHPSRLHPATMRPPRQLTGCLNHSASTARPPTAAQHSVDNVSLCGRFLASNHNGSTYPMHA